jgi:hypothetical protein
LAEVVRCLNCDAPVQGPYCHACGQSQKGLVRHLSAVLRDVLDTVFEYDSRLWRTMVPLYFRPGRITVDYLAGRRMRYVQPFRLFFVLTVAAFLAAQLVFSGSQVGSFADITPAAIERAQSAVEVEATLDNTLARLQERRAGLDERTNAGTLATLEALERAAVSSARQRLDWLAAADAARASGEAPPPPPGAGGDANVFTLTFDPIEVSWLPAAVNDTLKRWSVRAERNLRRADEDTERLTAEFLGTLPAVMFVLMPLFALLLKLFHLRQRRLYMEHLLVALHGHSFLALALLITIGLSVLGRAVPALGSVTGPLLYAALLWVPLYLLLMQARVYQQRGFVLLLKFALIGIVYAATVVVAVVVTVLITLVTA